MPPPMQGVLTSSLWICRSASRSLTDVSRERHRKPMTSVRHVNLRELNQLDRDADAAAGAGHPASGLRTGVVSPGGVAVAGRDGYLFIGDGANRWEQQFRGALVLSPPWIEAWRSLAERRRDEAAQRGLTFFQLVVPEKQVIYPEMRWPQGEVSGAGRPSKLLLTALGADLAFVYPEDEITCARAASPVFLRHNSHWTPSGCCAALAPLAVAAGAALDWETLTFAVEEVVGPQDLSRHFFDPAPTEAAWWLTSCGVEQFRHLAAPGRNHGASFGIENPAAQDPRTAIIFGDSYAFDAGLAAALTAVFARLICIWSKSVSWDLAMQHGAQVVIWESAERFLISCPDT